VRHYIDVIDVTLTNPKWTYCRWYVCSTWASHCILYL